MLDDIINGHTMVPPSKSEVEAVMVGQERWEQIRRMFFDEKMAIAQIARRLGMDSKTVRRWVRTQWKPYQRAAKEETLLTDHADFLRQRAAQVQYSAQILFQELRRLRGYRGSYETVKRFVAPLRELQLAAEATQTRFETPPGQQSQIDWGQTQVPFRSGRRTVHFFVLTLGYSRRGFYWPSAANEHLARFLDAHERAFEHFGGHTREHLYDRTRCVCYPDGDGRVVLNPTFKSFAAHQPAVSQATGDSFPMSSRYRIARRFERQSAFVSLHWCRLSLRTSHPSGSRRRFSQAERTFASLAQRSPRHSSDSAQHSSGTLTKNRAMQSTHARPSGLAAQAYCQSRERCQRGEGGQSKNGV